MVDLDSYTMARRPDFWIPPGSEGVPHSPRSTHESGQADIMRAQDIQLLRENLSRLGLGALRQAYHTAYSRCRMVNDRAPSARSIQEFVQVWKELWSRR